MDNPIPNIIVLRTQIKPMAASLYVAYELDCGQHFPEAARIPYRGSVYARIIDRNYQHSKYNDRGADAFTACVAAYPWLEEDEDQNVKWVDPNIVKSNGCYISVDAGMTSREYDAPCEIVEVE